MDKITQILQSKAPPPLPLESTPFVPPSGQVRPLDMFTMPQAPQADQVTQFKQAVAQGEPQAAAADKKIRMFAGDDPARYDSAARFLIEHPDDIDPSNSYQINTKLAQWSRQMPTPQQISIQDLGNIASGKGTDFLGLQQGAEKHLESMQTADALQGKYAAGGGAGGGGVTGFVYNKTKAALEAAGVQVTPQMEMEIVSAARNGLPKGSTITVNGQRIAIESLMGSEDVLRAQAAATAEGKAGVELGYAAPTAEATARGKATGEAIGTAQTNLGKVIDSSKYLEKEVSELVAHPGKGMALGKTSYLPTVRGSQASGFENRLKQINGAAFLKAYETLKGGGQITEIEGEKATAAITRMTTAINEEEFNSAANDFLGIVRTAEQRAKLQAGGDFGGEIPTSSGGLSADKQRRLQELRAKRDAGTLR